MRMSLGSVLLRDLIPKGIAGLPMAQAHLDLL